MARWLNRGKSFPTAGWKMNERAVLSVVRPDKDVDCFHPFNVGELMIGEKGFYPCTPASVMRLLAEYGVELSGKSCVIVEGRKPFFTAMPISRDCLTLSGSAATR